MDPPLDKSPLKIGMVGLGTMGSMMALLFADHGFEVHGYDTARQRRSDLQRMAGELGWREKLIVEADYEGMCESLKTRGRRPRTICFSLPHGEIVDRCIDSLKPFLDPDDMIIDCSNEHWKKTERRQGDLKPRQIHYVGCGVSGGYQSARVGPSMSPGGPQQALRRVMPLLQKVAAKDSHGRPCTAPLGPGGSGHYIKMVHNGIEQGMMAGMAEIWGILITGLGMTYEECADVFAGWAKSDVLGDCFLVEIGIDVCHTRDNMGNYVLASVRDKVVQDVDGSEGTGAWTCEEAIRMHIPSAAIFAAHSFRCASADLAQRIKNNEAMGCAIRPIKLNGSFAEGFIGKLKRTLVFVFLLSFIQGLDLIQRKSNEENWKVDMLDVLQVWRSGTIIRAGWIMDLLRQAFLQPLKVKESLLSSAVVAREVSANYADTKGVVQQAVETNQVIPTISQSLEFYKYSCGTRLPTKFMEAQLDYFGNHMYDLESEPAGEPVTGRHHFEWKPARGQGQGS